ncbi:MAG: Hpt domain-containing protein [Deltaproteobacteria bacterium]|nr:Hpt domain-containing protein [Deltaproteobacteria bacterium]
MQGAATQALADTPARSFGIAQGVGDNIDDLQIEFLTEAVRTASLCEPFLAPGAARPQPGEARKLHRLVHSIAGGAGIFGFESIGMMAGRAETELELLSRGARDSVGDRWRRPLSVLVDVLSRLGEFLDIRPGV